MLNDHIDTDTLTGWHQHDCFLNSQQLQQLIQHLKRCVWLDSSQQQDRGRFDIFSAEPLLVEQVNHNESSHPQHEIGKHFPRQTLPDRIHPLPFICGQLGLISYDYGEGNTVPLTARKAEKINDPDSAETFPLLYIGYYTWSYVYDRQTRQGYLTFSPLCDTALRQNILAVIAHSPEPSTTTPRLDQLDWRQLQRFEDYQAAFNKVMAYIHAGDCYQVNLAQAFEAHSDIPAADLYVATRDAINTPYSCYIALSEQVQLLSFSPEQFIAAKDAVISTRPIKGTIENIDGQVGVKENLRNSQKNQAENLMIVDLMRNDLGKVCTLHSIKVTKLFELQSYQNVHHLVSTIEGKLKAEVNPLQALLSCFPGGSITGAPKKRAMEIIAELEPESRSAYCGSVFYWDDSGNFDSNILIRSVVKSNTRLRCWGGGGIVADSVLEEEYQESLTKVKNLTGIVR